MVQKTRNPGASGDGPRRAPPRVRGHSRQEAEQRKAIEELPIEVSAKAQAVARGFDLLIATLLLVWFAGGIPWGGRVILRHGADPRRAALLALAIGAWFFRTEFPAVFQSSRAIRWSRKALDRLHEPRIRWATLALGTLWAIGLGVSQTLALRSRLYDVGIFHQILWAISTGHGFLSTVSRAGNFLMDHLSPSLALLAPVYWLSGASPLTLAVLQPLLIFGGAAAWIYLAERAPGAKPARREELAAATTLFALSFDSLWGNLGWGFHESSLAFFTLSWAFALLFLHLDWISADHAPDESEGRLRKVAVVLLFLVAAGTKEILLVDVAVAFGVWGLLELLTAQESRLNEGSLLAGGLFGLAAGLLLVFLAFEGISHPADKNYFARYYAYLGHDLTGFLSTLVSSPGLVWRTIGPAELGRYSRNVFLPWVFLPFAWGSGPDRLWILALTPSFLAAALANYAPLRGTDFHYVLELWPLLGCLTVLALAGLKSPRWMWLWAGLSLLAFDKDPFRDLIGNTREALRLTEVREHLRETPADLTIVADEQAGPWLSGREHVTRWPDMDFLNGACPKLLVARVNADEQTVAQPQPMDLLKRCSRRPPRVTEIWRAEEWRAWMPW